MVSTATFASYFLWSNSSLIDLSISEQLSCEKVIKLLFSNKVGCLDHSSLTLAGVTLAYNQLL